MRGRVPRSALWVLGGVLLLELLNWAALAPLAPRPPAARELLYVIPQGAAALCRMKEVFPGACFSVGFTAHGPLRWTQHAPKRS